MSEIRLIEVRENILSDNQDLASSLRTRLKRHKTYLLNLMSSPGAGKTSLILKTVERLKNRFRIGVLEADIDSVVDAEKVAASGVQAVQLRTGGFCHLDAGMVAAGLDAFDLDALDLVIIENVGNLVCPAEFDTGAIHNAMILSVPEGDDKPLKYPLMFSVSHVLLVNKIDYLSLSDFDMRLLRERVHRLNATMSVIPVSCRTGEGIDAWTAWLEGKVSEFIGQ
ncbi:MAG: hydrogenase nickel incorporation protein HypB [Desulfomonilia bacterium]|jgi:hydrogenase nickel incorporation protein HypB|uniref:Hydrogenase isoenzymes nickel incorporation protein HypB n=1 Tax=anaerobic digester metagenome TaxID=1263854 RepID=A0A485M2L9_9ZZZZ|nr:hydrogenase nickel incorporation protein HypB [Pseudomonadota bacterium]HON38834.1 hydrogenase nickel incorporation protein HypB [Deltaproteobacteria bacterium]HPX18696.1 hydrogenase nickel incorporation protein HypB [Deltaproteobacteria bacterium]HRS56786.1 hydrogenase nickel incorporation protein HypB [Desulfomonilia bacterium]